MICFAACAFADPSLTADQIAARMADLDASNTSKLEDYTYVRHYVINNERFHKHAEMTVEYTYRAGQGKTAQIVSMDNADGVIKHVFEKLIETEKASGDQKKGPEMGISPKNYSFQMAGTNVYDGVPCYVLQIQPKKKSKYLLDGKIWVSKSDFGLVHLEGRPSASVSFWVGKPQITQTFKKIGPVWMMASNRSAADVKIFGPTDLSIQSSDFRVKYFDHDHSITVAMLTTRPASD